MAMLIAASAVGLAAASPAAAETIPLNIFVTGSGFGDTPPSGSVSLTDSGDSVLVDFSVSSGDLATLYFNLIDDFDFGDLSISNVATAPDDRAASLIDGPQAPSNLDFDFGVDFGNGSSPGNVVTSGSFLLSLAGFDLDEATFLQTSTNAGGLSVTIAAKLQSLGTNGNGSATIGGNPGSGNEIPVPEPAAIGLLGLGMAVIGFARRRRTS